MELFRYVIKRYAATYLITILFIVLGIVGLTGLPVSFYPDFTVPTIFINTAYPGADPESVESEISKVIENAVSTVSGIDEVSSTSQEGFSIVQVSFAFGEDIEEKTDEVQSRLDRIKAVLPQDALTPSILKVNDFLAPPIELYLTSSELPLSELKLYAENRISPALSRLSGVAAVNITGGVERVVRIDIPEMRLKETGLSIEQIVNLVRANNLDFPIGRVSGSKSTILIRVEGRYPTVESIGELYIGQGRGELLRLRDIAELKLVEKRQTRFTRVNGRDAVGIVVRKPSGGNSIEVAKEVKRWLAENRAKLPPQLKLDVLSDESIFISSAINNVLLSLLLGGVLASLVIFLFLGSFRNTLVIVLAIPSTILITFLFMQLFKLSINTVSLGGLGMAVGMIIDSAIVVIENIYRYLESDDSGERAERVALATREVGLAISASVTTTIVVFLPLAFTRGLAKVLLGELALVIVFALSISIVIAITLIPVLSFYMLRVGKRRNLLSRLFLSLLDGIKRLYLALLKRALKHRFITIIIFFLFMVGSFGLLSRLDSGLFPESDQGQFQIVVDYPRGTGIDYTESEVRRLERWLLKQKWTERISTVAGEDPFFQTALPYEATITVFTDLSRPTTELMEESARFLKELPGFSYFIRVIDASVGFSRDDIDVIIVGNSLTILREEGERLSTLLKGENYTLNVKSNLSRGLPAYIFTPDREKIAALGLTLFEVGQLLRTSKSGSIATTFTGEQYDLDVEVIIAGAEEYRLDDIRNLPVTTRTAGVVPLKALGTITEGEAPAEINRISQNRSVNVTGSIINVRNKRPYKEQLQELYDKFEEGLPEGYFIDKSRAGRAIGESFRTLGIALLVAVFLVYIIMGVQFNSFSKPLVIALSIPFSLPGAVILLYLTGTKLNLPSFLGLIMLAGIVVNNGIILLDFVINEVEKGRALKEAILEAGSIRFRPIMMTTLTTVLGMLFLALNPGGGGSALRPLALAVIGGLSYSVLISLILIPVIFTFFQRRGKR